MNEMLNESEVWKVEFDSERTTIRFHFKPAAAISMEWKDQAPNPLQMRLEVKRWRKLYDNI
jgi:hypothetical protein